MVQVTTGAAGDGPSNDMCGWTVLVTTGVAGVGPSNDRCSW